METDFPAGSFDAIVSYYAVFHIPRQEHPESLSVDLHGGFGPVASFCLQLPGMTTVLDILKMTSLARPCFGAILAHRPTGSFLPRPGLRIEREGIVGAGLTRVDALDEVHPFFFAVRNERMYR